MIKAICFRNVFLGGQLLILLSLFAAAESIGQGEKRLIPATLETLTTLRAEHAKEHFSYELLETDQGTTAVPAELANTVSALSALRQTYLVPFCVEFSYQPDFNESIRFPFSIEANERLVDALDKLKRNSDGFLQWRLLHERIIISAQPSMGNADEVYIMDRPIRVKIEADLLEEALIQVEEVYNKAYPDLPLLVEPPISGLLLMERPEITGGGKFELNMEGTLREVFLSLIDQEQNLDIRYGMSEIVDPSGIRYYSFTLRKQSWAKRDTVGNKEQLMQSDVLFQGSRQRLEDYFSRIQN